MKWHAGDAIPGQRRVERALADFLHVDGRGQFDIGLNPAMLRALAGDAVELADRHCELTIHRLCGPAVERHQILHRALAEGALPENDAAVIVLDSGGKDL